MRIVVCDDEWEWIEILEKYLTEFRKTHKNITWDAFASSEELLSYTKENSYIFDVLITDIEMSGISGIELANMIREKDGGVVIFFLTSHDEYIRECFRPGPLNFWDKPLEYETFKSDMERAIQISKTNERVFKFKSGDSYLRIPYKNILTFQTSGKKIIVQTVDNTYEFYGSFREYERIWENAGFVKANRFYYINSEFIARLKTQDIYLLNGEVIKATPPNIKKIKNMLFEYDCLNITE